MELQKWVADEYLKDFEPEQPLVVQTVTVRSVSDYAREQGLSRLPRDHKHEIVRFQVCITISFTSARG